MPTYLELAALMGGIGALLIGVAAVIVGISVALETEPEWNGSRYAIRRRNDTNHLR